MARLARLLPSLMPNEPATTELDWTTLQGTTLAGGFQLESILSADEDYATFKVRVLGGSGANAIANVFALEPGPAEEQVALWQQLRRLGDPHLSIPLGAGQTTVDGATLVFVILARPDEKLAAILAERPLTPDEAGECLIAIIAALEELHRNGLVHGCQAPEHIFSIGESIKLSTDCARLTGTPPAVRRAPRYKAPESADQNTTPEADVWCLGATLVETLTQQPCRDALVQAEQLPAPFNSIARKCLDSDPAARPPLGQIEALYRARAMPEPKQSAAVAAAAGVGVAVASPAARPAATPPPAPRRANLTPRTGPPKAAVDLEQRKTRPVWPYVAAAALIALLIIWLWPRHRAQPPAATPTAAPARPATARESITVPPAETPETTSQPAARASTPAPVSKSTPAGPGQVWRVVLYTYTRESDAASRARTINAKHPDLGAATFSPTGGSPYLVVAGGRLTHDDAARLLQRVHSLGLPPDSYIQNYAQ